MNPKKPTIAKNCISCFSGCQLSNLNITVPRNVFTEAMKIVDDSPLEICEAALCGKLRIHSLGRIEIVVEKCETSGRVGHLPSSPLDFNFPFFILRGAYVSIISIESFKKRIDTIWTGLSKRRSSNATLYFSDFIFLWATAVAEADTISWFHVNAIVPDISPAIHKIKNYPFDIDVFRYCVQTESFRNRFKHLYRVSAGGTLQDYRYGFFVMNQSGILVAHPDGDCAIDSNAPAGVWCTGAEDEIVSTQGSSIANLHLWLALLRYAFDSNGQRNFSTPPVLAVHNRATNKVSFYSIHPENVSSSFPYIQFPTTKAPVYGYANKLHFGILMGCENLKRRSPRVDGQSRISVHLETATSTSASQNLVFQADFTKFIEAVTRFGKDLGCQVICVPILKARPHSAPRRNAAPPFHQNGIIKRSVKFNLPSRESHLPHQLGACEVPEASLLVEEGVVCNGSVSSAVPPPLSSYNPYRYFASPPPPPPPSLPSPPAPAPVCCHQSNHASSNLEITRLETLVQRLLEAQVEAQKCCPPVAAAVNVSTETESGSRTSVAVNTSLMWPTPSSIGLEKLTVECEQPKTQMESVGTQCGDEQQEYQAGVRRGCNGSPGLLPQLPGHSALTNIDPLQSIESVFSIDANYRNSLVPPRPASPREQRERINEQPSEGAEYSRLLAGIQRVLECPRPCPMRKTASVPGDISLIPPLFQIATSSTASSRIPETTKNNENHLQRPVSSAAAMAVAGVAVTGNRHPQWPTLTDADYEAELERQAQLCQEEVAAQLNYTLNDSFVTTTMTAPKSIPPPLPPTSTDITNERRRRSECCDSIPPVPCTPVSRVPTIDLQPSFHREPSCGSPAPLHPPPPPFSRPTISRRTPTTNESALLMGLAQKYLSPAVIARLAPTNNYSGRTTETTSFDDDYSRYRLSGDSSLLGSCSFVAARDGEQISTPTASGANRQFYVPEVSTIPQLTLTEEAEKMREQDFLPYSGEEERELDGGKTPTPRNHPSSSSEERILDLDHLRSLPKLL